MQIKIDSEGRVTGYADDGFVMEGADEYTGVVPDGFGPETCHYYQLVDDALVLDADYQAGITAQQQADELRERRASECFTIINRGGPWYARLSADQQAKLDAWYQAWLDAPATGIIPEPLEWIK